MAKDVTGSSSGIALMSYGGGADDIALVDFAYSVGKPVVANGFGYYVTYNSLGYPRMRIADGTLAGTSTVVSDGFTLNPSSLFSSGSGVYFSGSNLLHGQELWYSEGNEATTLRVCDIYEGPDSPLVFGDAGSSKPTDFFLADGKLFFTATDAYAGRELFYLPLAGAYSTSLDTGSAGIVLSTTAPVLGSTMTIERRNVTAGAISLLAISAPVSAPSNLLALPGHAAWIDLATAELMGIFGGTNWSISAAVPGGPSLSGLRINAQSYAVRGSFPAETSNGLSLVF